MASAGRKAVSLSYGAIERMKNGHLEENAVLQVLGYRAIPGHRENMFRMVLNDGEQLFGHAVLAGNLCQLIHQERLEKYTVFRLKSYELNKLENGSCVIVCTGIEIMAYGSEINCRIQKPISPSKGFKIENSSVSMNSANNQMPRDSASSSRNIDKGNCSGATGNNVGTSLLSTSGSKAGHDNCVSIKTEKSQNNFEAKYDNMVTNNSFLSVAKMYQLSCSSAENNLQSNMIASPVKMEGMTNNDNSNNDRLRSVTNMMNVSFSSTGNNEQSNLNASVLKNQGMTCNANNSCLNNHPKSNLDTAHHTFQRKNYENPMTAICSTVSRTAEFELNRSNLLASQGNIRENPMTAICSSASRTAELNRSNLLASQGNIGDNLCSIADISPYYNKWAIKAFVFYKTPLNSYDNPRGSGKFFVFYLRDNSGEIQATAFNAIAEKLFDSIQFFKTYLISKATVKIARQGSSCKGDFELIVEENTLIQQDEETPTSAPSSLFDFRTFKEIESLPKGARADIVAICTDVSGTSEVVTKLSREAVKRNLTLFDRSERSITITVWNSHAKNYDFREGQVIAIKNAKIIGYNATTVCLDSTSLIYIDPPIKETDSIKSWFHDLPASSQPQKTLSQHLPNSETYHAFKEITTANQDINWPVYYKTKANIVMVNRDKFMYQACPTMGCMKKVIDCNNGTYKCTKCNLDFKIFNWVLFLQLELADYSESRWTVAFREIAEDLIGKSSVELSRIKDEDPERLQDILNSLNLKSYIFDLRSHVENFNDNATLKTSIINFHPIDIPVYTKKLLVDIQRYHRILVQT